MNIIAHFLFWHFEKETGFSEKLRSMFRFVVEGISVHLILLKILRIWKEVCCLLLIACWYFFSFSIIQNSIFMLPYWANSHSFIFTRFSDILWLSNQLNFDNKHTLSVCSLFFRVFSNTLRHTGLKVFRDVFEHDEHDVSLLSSTFSNYCKVLLLWQFVVACNDL